MNNAFIYMQGKASMTESIATARMVVIKLARMGYHKSRCCGPNTQLYVCQKISASCLVFDCTRHLMVLCRWIDAGRRSFSSSICSRLLSSGALARGRGLHLAHLRGALEGVWPIER